MNILNIDEYNEINYKDIIQYILEPFKIYLI